MLMFIKKSIVFFSVSVLHPCSRVVLL